MGCLNFHLFIALKMFFMTMTADYIKLLMVVLLIHVSVPAISAQDEESLQYVSLVFRHGERTLSSSEIYPKDNISGHLPESYGYGYLTNDGKRRAYDLGTYLRNEYGNFLGEMYTANLVSARTTDLVRTKQTLMFALAALFPLVTAEKWTALQWQPIPYDSVPLEEDNLLTSSMFCPLFLKPFEEELETSDYVKYLNEKFHDTMVLASKVSGSDIRNILDLSGFGSSVIVKKSLGLKSGWPDDKMEDLLSAMVARIHLYNATPLLRRRNGGVILHQMVKNMKSVMNGTAVGKMSLLSGHDHNVGAVLSALGVYVHHVPAFTSAVILELHLIDGTYYVKVVHYKGIPETASELRIRGCDSPCPFAKFVEIVEDDLATSDDICGGEIIDSVLKRKYKSLGLV